MKPYKIYLAKLKRTERVVGQPNCVYKIGITSSMDAMDRLCYNREDELNPITSVFPDIKVMSTIWAPDKESAEQIETFIMNTVKGASERFHNWYEPRQISGITEMRKWDYDEVQQIFGLFDRLVKEGKVVKRYSDLHIDRASAKDHLASVADIY
jgi:hypothetical protein